MQVKREERKEDHILFINMTIHFIYSYMASDTRERGNPACGLLYTPSHIGPALGGAGPNWEQFWSAQIPSQFAPRYVELGAGPNWEQLVQLA